LINGPVLVDAGPLIAIFSHRDGAHELCVAQLSELVRPLYTCWPVITEAAWLLRTHPLAVERLLDGFREGLLRLLPLDEAAMPWIAAFMKRYRNIGAQLADASLVYLAEREGIDSIFTLDRRDFTVYRMKGNRSLRLLP